MTKILICDIYNFLLFINVNEQESLKLSMLAFNSILIKFKYISVSPNNSNNFQEYKKKIFENLNQFGAIEKNKYFKDSMKNILLDTKDDNNQESNKKIQLSTIETNSLTTENKEQHNIFQKECDIKNMEEKPVKNIFDKEKKSLLQNNKSKGIGSYLISALGFGPESEKLNNIKQKEDNIQNQRKIENPKEKEKKEEPNAVLEKYYDSEKKRWVLRGKIFDDESPGQSPNTLNKENDETNKTGLETPSQVRASILPPPKSKILSTTGIQTPSKDHNNQEKSEKPEISNFNSSSYKITNPFSNSNSSKPIVKAPPKPNLTNRYANYPDYNK
jgi:hypothetical protein